MPLPAPVNGLVIRYSYLWEGEQQAGEQSGRKDRPCAIILAVRNEVGENVVIVLPITHSPPVRPAEALEIPAAVKSRLKLDDRRSWVVLTQANRFVWPGPDLRPAAGGTIDSVAYGLLPRAFYNDMKSAFIALLKKHGVGVVRRDS